MSAPAGLRERPTTEQGAAELLAWIDRAARARIQVPFAEWCEWTPAAQELFAEACDQGVPQDIAEVDQAEALEALHEQFVREVASACTQPS